MYLFGGLVCGGGIGEYLADGGLGPASEDGGFGEYLDVCVGAGGAAGPGREA